ncbi:MAG: hypothetical protein F4Y82_03860 [Cenarchaeum sp. SB0665_bin_23]|nr:hypothetical protein [Cenarchaeum sp. SB0667_bin_13]MXY61236.1 hypothetical protein [Cenarchaeum sp. SB0665_bin_23]MXZ93720.1 hypothetical protein [Cenarchaeum sp. SB0666_bin_15]MYC79163.1 hypothetical protein [Cenarchaeum sp. SB0661_bin_35]MYD58993.1 hypothetical protein [Cenarchaeum sp. SB0678_bin_8]MYG33054.1 hypothetical protein [Cenarchaeum sp. SB0677_bin_16]MYI51972.1 hypothetical protein [Cenarchaeum sp. SB0673_bin_9]MYJ27875.1 hypothetical protein [Cenarchaeum sp. SB0672_bin_9]
MTDKVVIDNQSQGWANDNMKLIQNSYKQINHVKDLPDMTADSSDWLVAAYCIQNNCDMLTSDKGAYTAWLDHEIKGVRISVFGKGEQTIYKIQLVLY